MKRRTDFLWLVIALAVLVGALAAFPLMAQQATQSPSQAMAQSAQAQDPQDQQQEPGQSQARPGRRESQAQSQDDVQTFTGTMVKTGDRYMLQEANNGKSYDIDNQEAKKYQAMQVTIRGTLDPDGKTIHVK